MNNHTRSEVLDVELLQWVKDRGLWPEHFFPEDEFLIPATQKIKTYWHLTPAQVQQALWIPCPEALPFMVACSRRREGPGPRNYYLELWNGAHRRKVAFGFGQTQHDALIAALQRLREKEQEQATA
ncbi:MAG: hypothetical protein ABSD47_11280 [Candidatus Methylomirabilota bacterium]|jgi:hypothetical protein